MDNLEHIKMVAAQWVTRRHSAQWSDSDEAALTHWLNASMSHRLEYLCHEKTWREANRLKVLGAGTAPGMVPTMGAWRASPYFRHLRSSSSEPPLASTVADPGSARRARKARKYAALAASVLMVCTLSYFGWSLLRGDRYSTAIGVMTAVPLSDGSKITLNTDSEVRVAVTEIERRIVLDQGEAFFDVATDPSRPFTVVAGEKRVVAVGTKFSVKRDRNDVRVVVTEGKVALVPASSSQDEVLLTAGSIAQTRDERLAVQQRSLPQAEQFLSWREGYLMFDEVSLAEAVAEFNRYNSRKFVIEDPRIAGVPVTGHFRSTSVEPFATLLEKGFPVTVTRQKDKIILGSP